MSNENKNTRNSSESHFADHGTQIVIKVKDKNIEGALRILKKRVKSAGIVEELRERQYHESKSNKKHQRLVSLKRTQRISKLFPKDDIQD